MKPFWTYQECPNCEGFGIDYCLTCEERCDHDKLCTKCKGNGEIPRRVIPIICFGIWINEPGLFWATRQACQKELDTFDMYGNLR